MGGGGVMRMCMCVWVCVGVTVFITFVYASFCRYVWVLLPLYLLKRKMSTYKILKISIVIFFIIHKPSPLRPQSVTALSSRWRLHHDSQACPYLLTLHQWRATIAHKPSTAALFYACETHPSIGVCLCLSTCGRGCMRDRAWVYKCVCACAWVGACVCVLGCPRVCVGALGCAYKFLLLWT